MSTYSEHEQVPLTSPSARMETGGFDPSQLTPTPRFSNTRSADPSEKWKNDLDAYIAKDNEFLTRCQNNQLLDRDVGQICTALETAGTGGATLEIFSARLRLLEKEMVSILRKYPQIERSFRISSVNRKGTLTENLIRSAATNANAAKELLNNPELNKNLFDKDREFNLERSIHETVTEKLLERGIVPCRTTQVLYVSGHKDRMDENLDEVMKDKGYISAEKLMEMLRQ